MHSTSGCCSRNAPPYLALEHQDGMVIARFADERIPFLARDCLALPIRNATIEELAGLLVERLRARPEIADLDLRALELGVSSSPGQWAFSHWEPT